MDRKKKLEALRAWLQGELDAFRTPRQSDVIQQAKALRLRSPATVIEWLKREFPAYQAVSRPKYEFPAKIHRNQLPSFYGIVSVDLAFFGKQSRILQNLGITKTELGPALIMTDMSTRFAIVEAMGPQGKSAPSLLAALKRAFAKYKAQYKIEPTCIVADKEKALQSNLVQSYLKSVGTKTQFLEMSRKKSNAAENLIRNLRASISLLKKTHRDKKFTWVSVIDPIVDGYNRRKITYLGKQLSFRPIDITPQTFGAYLAQVQSKFKYYSMAQFPLSPDLLRWKFPIGTRVRLIKKAVAVPGLGTKASEDPLEEDVWIIVKRAVNLNLKNQVVPTVFLQLEGGKKTTRQSERACVPVL